MGVITAPGEEEEVIIFEPVGRPEDAPVTEPSPDLVPECEIVPALWLTTTAPPRTPSWPRTSRPVLRDLILFR
jgi:hypothetical protein